MEKVNIERIIERIKDLPTLPDVVMKVNQLANDPKTSATDIAKIITTDQSLSMKILKLVNSAFFGFPGEIKSISHAITILGFKTIQNIALTISVFDMFGKSKSLGNFDRKEFWKHSIGCAVCGRLVATKLHYEDADLAFTGGLLHDIGKIILDQYLHNEFVKVLEELTKKPAFIYDVEKEVLGFNHSNLGEQLASNWKLPKPLIDVIGHHHKPMAHPQDDKLTYIVHMADVICRAKKIGANGDSRQPKLGKEIVEELGFSLLDLELILRQVNSEMNKAIDFLKLTSAASREQSTSS